MHKRDYLVKQFEEFGRVMGVILGLRREGKLDEFSALIEESVKKYTATELKYAEALDDKDLIQILTEERKLTDDQLKMLGDLLFEKGNYYSAMTTSEIQSTNCYKKSFIIYSFLKEHATITYSLDMQYKLEVLQKMNLQL
jgi:hypothetical protein